MPWVAFVLKIIVRVGFAKKASGRVKSRPNPSLFIPLLNVLASRHTHLFVVLGHYLVKTLFLMHELALDVKSFNKSLFKPCFV